LEREARTHCLWMPDGTGVRVLEFGAAAAGSSRALLLVPGFATVFQGWAEAVRLLSAGFRLYYFETREKASSLLPRRRAVRAITLHRMALDVAEVVRQLELESRPYYVLASSTGTTLVLEALSRGWIRPRGAILVGPMARHRLSRVAALLAFCLPQALKGVGMPFYRLYLHTTYTHRERQREQYTKYVRAAAEVSLPRIRRLMWEMTSYDGTHLLAAIRTPCLLVGAASDNMHRSAETRRVHGFL
jgi:alpha-beta hydrolase superfamily lysophospholipase